MSFVALGSSTRCTSGATSQSKRRTRRGNRHEAGEQTLKLQSRFIYESFDVWLDRQNTDSVSGRAVDQYASQAAPP